MPSAVSVVVSGPTSVIVICDGSALPDRFISSRKPAAYLTNEAWLQGVPFYVDERAIVPRSFIAEVLADGSIDAWLGEHTRRVLDLCTGNGSLAVLAAMAFPEVTVDAADISDDALAVARINVDQHGLQDRITLLKSDGVSGVNGPYDLVLCNPPYVNAASMQASSLASPSNAISQALIVCSGSKRAVATFAKQASSFASPSMASSQALSCGDRSSGARDAVWRQANSFASPSIASSQVWIVFTGSNAKASTVCRHCCSLYCPSNALPHAWITAGWKDQRIACCPPPWCPFPR